VIRKNGIMNTRENASRENVDEVSAGMDIGTGKTRKLASASCSIMKLYNDIKYKSSYILFVSHRSGERGRRIENLRPLNHNRNRSLSPRHSQHGEYPSSSAVLSHLMNPPSSKGYQGHLADDGHYPPTMHYDSGIRRSNEDRAGTPTVSERSLYKEFVIYFNISIN